MAGGAGGPLSEGQVAGGREGGRERGGANKKTLLRGRGKRELRAARAMETAGRRR